jgi:hypothetical protein
MRTITTIEVIPGGTLYVDLLKDPLKLVIRRQDAGRVHIEVGELSHLTAVLADIGANLTADEERFVRIENSDNTLFVDSTLWEPPDEPAVVIWRMSGGLVRIEAGELQRLIEALVLAGEELAALAGWELNGEGSNG